MSKKDVVPVTNGGGVPAIPQDMMSRLAGYAKQTQTQEVAAGQFFSTRSGVLTLAGQPMKDNKMQVVVLRAMFENTLYEGVFNPDDIQAPKCFAFSDTGVGMAPHDNSTEKQSVTCDVCPQLEWKLQPNGRKRKTCKEQRRLSCMPADATASAQGVADAQTAYLRIPVTSVKNWQAYAQRLSGGSIPPFAAITQISVIPDQYTQFKIEFECVRTITDPDVLAALCNRYEAEETRMAFPYAKKVVPITPLPPPTAETATGKF